MCNLCRDCRYWWEWMPDIGECFRYRTDTYPDDGCEMCEPKDSAEGREGER